MSERKRRAGRLRAVAIGGVIAGVALAYPVGEAFPAQVRRIVAGLRRSARTRSREGGSREGVISA